MAMKKNRVVSRISQHRGGPVQQVRNPLFGPLIPSASIIDDGDMNPLHAHRLQQRSFADRKVVIPRMRQCQHRLDLGNRAQSASSATASARPLGKSSLARLSRTAPEIRNQNRAARAAPLPTIAAPVTSPRRIQLRRFVIGPILQSRTSSSQLSQRIGQPQAVA